MLGLRLLALNCRKHELEAQVKDLREREGHALERAAKAEASASVLQTTLNTTQQRLTTLQVQQGSRGSR